MAGLMLVIGNKNYSSWSLRPWLFMRHAGLAFEEKRVALSLPTTSAELAPFASNGKVPVLIDDDLVVWDSLAILEYVSECYTGGAGWPAETRLRALGRSISAEMHSSFAALRNALPMNCRKQAARRTLPPAVQRDVDRIESLWARCYASHAGGKWLLGEFSIADAMYAPVALRFSGYDVPLQPTSRRFVAAILGHPALREWIEAAKSETEVIDADEVD